MHTPILTPVPSTPHRTKRPYTRTLLGRVHSPATNSRIFAQKIAHKPLIVHADPTVVSDARSTRRIARLAKIQHERRKQKKNRPRPLTAAEKQKLCVHEISKAERKWSIYEGLNRMWQGYMREILGVKGTGQTYLTPLDAGPKIASADLHGAEIECVRSRCVSRTGVRGIVVRDTKFTFVVITRKDELKTLPKEGSVFRIEVMTEPGDAQDQEASNTDFPGRRSSNLVFELQGEQFKNRSADRANKRFKMHIPPDL